MKKIFTLSALAVLALTACHKKAYFENDGIPVIPADPPVIVYEDSGNLVTGTGDDEVELNSTYAWKAEGNTITVDVQFDLAEYVKRGGWELGYFMWDLASINDFLGISVVGDTTEDTFYGVNPDGSNAGLTSYKPGMWINQDGTASGSGGLNYWQWYIWTGRDGIYYDYGEGTDTAFNGLFLIGGNPSNIAGKQAELIGQTVTSKAKLIAAGTEYDFVVNYHYYLSEKSVEGAGKLVQFQEDAEGNVTEEETLSSYTYKIGENSLDITVDVNTEGWLESESWEIGHFTIDRAQFKEITGFDPAELDETTFYVGDPDDEMTSYKPGMWLDELGEGASGWSDGVIYWQWYVWGGKTDRNGKVIGYDYSHEQFPDRFVIGGNPGNVGKITYEETIPTQAATLLLGDKEYPVYINYLFHERVLPETEGYPEGVAEGVGTPYPYGGGADGDHQVNWYFDENGLTVDVDAYVPTIQANGDWIFTAATIPTDIMTAYLGIEDIEQLFDLSYFYPLNPDGTPSGDWTTNKPGQWVQADGTACGWSDGRMYWWYQWGDHKYEGHFTEGLFLVGTNPSNVESVIGQTVTSIAQLGDKRLTVKVHFWGEYPKAKSGKVGPHSYSWAITDAGIDITAEISAAAKDDSWGWMGFPLNEVYLNQAFGIDVDALTGDLENGFYPVANDGTTKLEEWTSYVPGMWFAQDGNAGGYAFWQYYTTQEHEFAGYYNMFYVGKNPSNTYTPGDEVTSKAILGGKAFNFTMKVVE
jgi:hypothetical protein